LRWWLKPVIFCSGKSKAKARSVFSNAIAELDIVVGLTLFDRNKRHPQQIPASERV